MYKTMKYILLLVFVCSSFLASAQKPITWSAGMNLAANSFGNLHPRITVDGRGNPLIIWGRASGESLFFSRYDGKNFTAPKQVNPMGIPIATASWMGPQIASKGDTVYIVMKQTPENLSTSHIYLVSSFDGGKSFSPAVRVDAIADSLSRFPTVTVDDRGNPIVAFMKFNAAFMDSRWAVTRSTDMGKTFLQDVKASGYSGKNALVCDCCPGTILSTPGVTAMLYRDNLSNIRDIWAGISRDESATFASGFHAENTNWNINSCPATGPDGVIIGDSLYSVFMSSGTGSARTYLSSSSLTKSSVSTVTRLGGTINGLSQQKYPRIATDGTALAIVWRQTVNGVAQLPIGFTPSVGAPLVYDTVDLADITTVDVAMHNGTVYVVWEDDNSGTIKIRTGSYASPSAVEELTESDMELYPNPAENILHVSAAPAQGNVRIYNPLGAIVLETEQSPAIDVTALVPGVYFIHTGNRYRTFVKR